MLKVVLLYPISILFSLIVKLRNLLYDKNILSIEKSRIPIISIGNIDIGGTGKTPFVIALCQMMEKQNLHPLIITRGYKRQSKELIFINNHHNLQYKVEDLGDEPYYIINSLSHTSMVVSSNKKKAVKFANTLDGIDYIVLDDGYQTRYLQKNIDVVLLNMNRSKNWYQLLPLGGLREPVKNLNRADFIYTIKGENSLSFKSKKLNVLFKVIEYKNGIQKNEPAIDEQKNWVSACGIGDPDFFNQTIKELNLNVVEKVAFENHAYYDEQKIKKLEYLLQNNDGLITTYKDFVKLNQNFLNKYLIYVIKMEIEINDKKFIRKLIS